MKWHHSYKNLIENSSEGIIILNPETGIIDANCTMISLLGYRLKELRKLSINDVLKKGHAACFENIKDGKQCLFETTIVRKNGELKEVEISCKKFNDGAFVAFIRDISDRKKIRESLQYHSFILKNMMEAVISTDVSFKILSCNQAAEKLYGWKEKEVLSKKITDLLKTDFINDNEENVYHMLSKSRRWTGEVIQQAKSGLKYQILTSFEMLKNDKNETVGYIFINVDISEKMFFKNKVEESLEEFKKIAWMQSHEVRAPLTNILGLVEIIDFENENAAFNKQLIDYIKTSARKMDAAVKKIVKTSLIVNNRIGCFTSDRL